MCALLLYCYLFGKFRCLLQHKHPNKAGFVRMLTMLLVVMFHFQFVDSIFDQAFAIASGDNPVRSIMALSPSPICSYSSLF